MSEEVPESPETEEGRGLPVLTRALAHAATAAAFAYPLSTNVGVWAAGLGAFAGALLAPRIARGAMRTLPLSLLTSCISALVCGLGHSLLVGYRFAADSLGPAGAMTAADIWLFGLGAFGTSLTLRVLSFRAKPFAVLEVAAVVAAMASVVVAHRHGAINRPFEIADPILATGGDPTTIFYGVGALAIAVMITLLLGERRWWRTLLHLGAVAVLMLLFLASGPDIEPPEPPPPADGLGLRGEGEGEEGEAEQNQEQGEGGQPPPEQRDGELEFQDNLQQNQNTPVAVVLLHDDYSPPGGTYYFRQSAFSQFNGQRLVSASAPEIDRDVNATFPSARQTVHDAAPLNALRQSVETTVAMIADHPRPFGLEAMVELSPWNNPNPDRFRHVYRVTSAALTTDFVSLMGRNVGDSSWSEETRAHYIRPPDDPRYQELAARIVQEELPDHLRDNPAARVAAVTHWLGEHGTYSLQNNHAGHDDPTGHFLFGDITGYCVHFSHASVYLMRALGIPARVATGYAVDEAQRQGGSAILISSGTAHAWPEIYFEGAGWVTVDVIPQTVISPPPGPPDPDLQRLLGELVRGLDAVPPEEDAPLPAAIDLAREIWAVTKGLLLALLLGGLLFLFGAKLWRRFAPRYAATETQARLRYRAALDRLGEVKILRAQGESPEAFAARLSAEFPSLTPLTRAHLATAFGGGGFSLQPTGASDAEKNLRSELREAVPMWRRALGLLTPWSWLRTR